MDQEEPGEAVPAPSGVHHLPAPSTWSAGAFDRLPIGVGLWSFAGDLQHANPVMHDLLGLDRAGTPDRLLEVVLDDDRSQAAIALDELRAGRRNSLECRLHGAPFPPGEGISPWPLRAHITVWFETGSQVGGFLVQVFDFQPAEDGPPLPQNLSRVLEEGSDFLLVVDTLGAVTYGNRAARDALGVASRGVPRTQLVDVLEPDSQELFQAVVRPELARSGAWQGELAFRTAGGGSVPVSARFVAHGAAEGRTDAVVGDLSVFARDITELKNAERRLRQLATHDYLTGLPNRLLLYDRLELALNRYLRYGTSVALLFCDLDGFKPVNDRYGHQIGDVVLEAVADRIHSVVRDTDTAARVGGDEFAVLIEGVDDLQQLTTVADRLVARVAEPVEVGAVRAQVGISIGLVVASPKVHEVDTMVALADTAMYRAKAGGRGRYVVVTDDDIPDGGDGTDG